MTGVVRTAARPRASPLADDQRRDRALAPRRLLEGVHLLLQLDDVRPGLSLLLPHHPLPVHLLLRPVAPGVRVTVRWSAAAAARAHVGFGCLVLGACRSGHRDSFGSVRRRIRTHSAYGQPVRRTRHRAPAPLPGNPTRGRPVTAHCPGSWRPQRPIRMSGSEPGVVTKTLRVGQQSDDGEEMVAPAIAPAVSLPRSARTVASVAAGGARRRWGRRRPGAQHLYLHAGPPGPATWHEGSGPAGPECAPEPAVTRFGWDPHRSSRAPGAPLPRYVPLTWSRDVTVPRHPG